MTTETEKKKMHHWLIAAQVVFANPQTPEDGGVITVNAMLLTPEQHVTVAELKRANQAVVANFYQKMNDTSMKVIDVIFIGFNWIGHMAHEKATQEAPTSAK